MEELNKKIDNVLDKAVDELEKCLQTSASEVIAITDALSRLKNQIIYWGKEPDSPPEG